MSLDKASPWVLVLDVGTSSVRVWFYDRQAKGLDPGPGAQREYVWHTTADGAMEAGADALFQQVVRVIDAALSHAREAGLEIAAVAIATFWHSLVGLKPDGSPATPLYSWGDTRAADAALRLRERLDEEAVHRRTGSFLHPSYPSAKLLWLRERDSAAFERVAAWGSFAEYLEQRFFGERRCSFSMASGSGLLDIHRLVWDEEMLEATGLHADRLSPLVDTDAPPRGLEPEFAWRWPELTRVPWFPALGDGACANVGSGAVGRDRMGLTVGTSAAVRTLWEPEGEEEPVPLGLWCYRLDRRRFVAGGALSNGGNAVAYLRRTLHLPGEREWEAELAVMEPDAHGLTILPFLVGERGPGWQAETEAAVMGLTQATPAVHVLHAWLEAVAYRVAGVYRLLENVFGAPERVLASGGALHASPVWTQILADVLGRPLALTNEREAAARGAALVAQEQLGWLRDLREVPVPETVDFEPDVGHHTRYGAAIHRQRALEEALGPWRARSASAHTASLDSGRSAP
jgi:gluconokinase